MPNIRRTRSRPLSRLLALILALAVGATLSLAGAGGADADTPNGRIAHVSLELAGTGSPQARGYRQFIESVQNAAGHEWIDDIGETQTNQAALLRVDIAYEGETLRLWFTPNNMYLRGFTNVAGMTFAFDDYPLRRAMLDLYATRSPDTGLLPPLNSFHQLTYGSGYIDLVRAAQRDRTATPMSFGNLLTRSTPC